MLPLIESYDSLTCNLAHFPGELEAEADVRRNDATGVGQAIAPRLEGIVPDPGPRDTNRAGICLETITAATDAGVSLPGVFLDHQAIGQAFGGIVVSSDKIAHGKVGRIRHSGADPLAGLRSPFGAATYLSLTVERRSPPYCLEVTAWLETGTVMGIRHRELPISGVRCHPESIAAEHGHALLNNFLDLMPVEA